MADTEPPYSEYHPLRALMLIQNNPPPVPQNVKKISKEFREFLASALVKDPVKRPTAEQMMKVTCVPLVFFFLCLPKESYFQQHPFLKLGSSGTSKLTMRKSTPFSELVVRMDSAQPDEIALSYVDAINYCNGF